MPSTVCSRILQQIHSISSDFRSCCAILGTVPNGAGTNTVENVFWRIPRAFNLDIWAILVIPGWQTSVNFPTSQTWRGNVTIFHILTEIVRLRNPPAPLHTRPTHSLVPRPLLKRKGGHETEPRPHFSSSIIPSASKRGATGHRWELGGQQVGSGWKMIAWTVFLLRL